MEMCQSALSSWRPAKFRTIHKKQFRMIARVTHDWSCNVGCRNASFFVNLIKNVGNPFLWWLHNSRDTCCAEASFDKCLPGVFLCWVLRRPLGYLKLTSGQCFAMHRCFYNPDPVTGVWNRPHVFHAKWNLCFAAKVAAGKSTILHGLISSPTCHLRRPVRG